MLYREVSFVGRVIATSFDAPVISSPFGAETLPFFPSLFNGIVPVPGPEHLPQVLSHFALITVAHIADYIAFKMCRASLELSAGKDLTDDILQPFQAVRAYHPTLPTPRSYRSFSVSPQPVALSVGLLYMPSTSRVLSSFTASIT